MRVIVCFFSVVQLLNGFSINGFQKLVINHGGKLQRDKAISHNTKLYGGLDLSDVLDPENEEMNAFIKTLKSQMISSQHVSPREITNRIKAFFSSKKINRSREEINSFKSYLVSNQDVLDVVNAILLFEGCTRNRMSIKDILDLDIVLKAMEKASPTLTSSVIYRGMSCLNSQNSFSSAEFRTFLAKYLSLFFRRIEESDVILNEIDLCPAIFTLSQFNANGAAMRGFVKFAAKSLSATESNFPSKSLCSAIFGLRKMQAVSEIRLLLKEITKKIKSSTSLYHPINVCIALNGLQSMSDEHIEVRELLSALLEKSILADEQGIDRVTDREISMALMGIKEMGGLQTDVSMREGHRSDASREVREVLKYISALLRDHTGPFEAKRLSFAILGLSGLSSKTAEVKEILAELVTKAASHTGSMTGQEVSMTLRGLTGLDSDDINVRNLIKQVIPLVKSCKSWTSSDCQSALIGLQSMHYSSSEANKLVDAICDLIDRSEPISLKTPEQVSMCLYGIQGMGSVTPEARRLLKKLPAMMSEVARSGAAFSGRDVSQALYGLRSTSCHYKETLDLLEELQPFILNAKGFVSSQNIASAMCGLQNMESSSPQVCNLLTALVPLLERCSGTLSGKGVSKCLNGLQRLRSKDPETLQVCNALAAILERSESEFHGFDDFFQLSGAITGFTNKDPEESSVLRLGNSFARLLRTTSQTNNTRLHRLIPSAERIAISMYALQDIGVSVPGNIATNAPKTEVQSAAARDRVPSSVKLQYKQFPFAVTIMTALLDFLRAMPLPTLRSLGMIMQGFKGVVTPSRPYEEALEIIADKMQGWSSRSERNVPVSGELLTESQVTLRSCLTGLALLRRDLPVRNRILVLLCREARLWPASSWEKRTLEVLSSTFFYKGTLLDEAAGVAGGDIMELLHSLDGPMARYGLGPHFKQYDRKPNAQPSDEKTRHVQTPREQDHAVTKQPPRYQEKKTRRVEDGANERGQSPKQWSKPSITQTEDKAALPRTRYSTKPKESVV